jgi:hypothetical protein
LEPGVQVVEPRDQRLAVGVEQLPVADETGALLRVELTGPAELRGGQAGGPGLRAVGADPGGVAVPDPQRHRLVVGLGGGARRRAVARVLARLGRGVVAGRVDGVVDALLPVAVREQGAADDGNGKHDDEDGGESGSVRAAATREQRHEPTLAVPAGRCRDGSRQDVPP